MPVLSRRFKVLIAGATILIFSGCGGWKPRPSAWSNATGAEQFERLWWSDIQAKKWNEVGSRMAASYVSINAEGTKDREQTLAHLKLLEIEELAIGDVDVRPNGHDLVVTYTMTLRGTLGGAPLVLERVPMMTVWQQQKSGWIAIAHSSVQTSDL
jgi:Domain of unknown function (DUF4440)